MHVCARGSAWKTERHDLHGRAFEAGDCQAGVFRSDSLISVDLLRSVSRENPAAETDSDMRASGGYPSQGFRAVGLEMGYLKDRGH